MRSLNDIVITFSEQTSHEISHPTCITDQLDVVDACSHAHSHLIISDTSGSSVRSVMRKGSRESRTLSDLRIAISARIVPRPRYDIMSSTTPVKRARTRTGCLQCKRRRVRCDEEGRPDVCGQNAPGSCAACRRLDLTCAWPEPARPRTARLKRSTNSELSVCLVCSLTASLCSGEKPSCASCSSRGYQCVYATLDDESESEEVLQRARMMTADATAVDHVPRHLVTAFFTEVSPCTVLNFVHERTFLESFDENRASRPLVYAMAAFASKFSPIERPRSGRWLELARSSSHSELAAGRFSASTLACLVLCAHLELYERDFPAAWMTSGTAIRLALALRLNSPARPGNYSTPIEQETRRRLMWAVQILDMYISDGFPEFSSIPASIMMIELPCDEAAYASGDLYNAGQLCMPGFDVDFPPALLHPRTLADCHAQYITLFSIRTKILFYARTKAEGSPPWQVDSIAQRCHSALHQWLAQLPPDLLLEEGGSWKERPATHISTLLSMHMWYSSSYIDLGRLMIYSFAESASVDMLRNAPRAYIQRAQEQSVEYAMRILDLCRIVDDNVPDFELRDPHVSILCFQACRILLWDLFRQDRPSALFKRYLVDSFRPALTILYRAAPLFPFSQNVLLDTLSLFTRYGIGDLVLQRMPDALAAPLGLLDISARHRNPALRNSLDCTETSDNAEQTTLPVAPGKTPDQGQSDLFHPPFDSSMDPSTNIQNPNADPAVDISLAGVMSSGDQTMDSQNPISTLTDPMYQSADAELFDINLINSVLNSAGHQDWLSRPTNMSRRSSPTRNVAPLLARPNTSGLSQFPVIPDEFGDMRGDQDIWTALFGGNGSDT